MSKNHERENWQFFAKNISLGRNTVVVIWLYSETKKNHMKKSQFDFA